MKLRLRTAALSAIGVLTAGLLQLTGAPPAQAASGETCMDPVISGSIQRVVGESSTGIHPVYAEFEQSGFTSAACPAGFTQYRYRITFTYDGRTVSSYQSRLRPTYRYTVLGRVRTGTEIEFPTLRLSFAGYKPVTVTVTSGSKSVFSSVWCRSDEETTDTDVPAVLWGGYNTLSGVPRARINACP